MKQLYARVQHRINESATWLKINPILAPGEIGVESNTRKFKYGDGISHWKDLEYAYGSGLTSIFANSADDLKNNYPAEEYPGAIAIVPQNYTTAEEGSFVMDTPYLSLRKNGRWYWTVFSDQKDKLLVSNQLDAFILDASPLG